MQWGDLSYVSDSLATFIGRGNSNNEVINLRRPISRILPKPHKAASIDGRLMKIKILTEVNKREQTPET